MIGLLLAIGLLPGQAPPPTIAENFANYCQQSDASKWFCDTRHGLIPDSQKWDIVAGYCLDQQATLRLADDKVIAAGLELLKKVNLPRATVCEEHRRVPVPMALEYNHRTGRWSVLNKGFEANRRRIQLDPVLLVPVAHLASNDRVGIIITETNPLLFLANRGDAREDNIDQVKGLEQLLGLLGPAFQRAVTDVSQTIVMARREQQNVQLRVGRITWTAADRNAMASVLGGDVSSASNAELELATRTAAADSDQVHRRPRSAQELDRRRNTALDPMKKRLKAFLEQRARLQSAAQRLEQGPALLDGPLDTNLESPASWTEMFVALGKAGDSIPSLTSCASLFDAFVGVVSAKAEEPVTVASAASRFSQFFNDGTGTPDARVCAQLSYDAALAESVQAIQTAARPAVRDPGNPAPIKTLRDAQATARERHLEMVFVLQRFLSQVDAGKQGIKETVAKEEETRKASVVLGLMGARARDAGIRTIDGNLLLTNRIFVEDEIYSSSALKVRITPLKIALNSQFVESVPTERPKETSTTYRFVRRGLDRLSFGVGMIVYTPAFSATYTAVDPDPSTNTSTTTTTKISPVPGTEEATTVAHPELKVIREKEKLPRAGSYAVFVNERIFGSAGFGVGGQFGVAMSSENPAFLFGASINMTPYATLGVGGGRFRLKQLSPLQQGDSVRVLNADEISVDTLWKWDSYVSLSINLSGLPLFK